MLKTRAIMAMLPAMILCGALGRLAADEPDLIYRLPKGTMAVGFHLSKGQDRPEDAIPGKDIDIVCEISEPVQTGIALLNVRLLAVDSGGVDKEGKGRSVTVQLAEAQREVLAVMLEHGTKLTIKLHEKANPK